MMPVQSIAPDVAVMFPKNSPAPVYGVCVVDPGELGLDLFGAAMRLIRHCRSGCDCRVIVVCFRIPCLLMEKALAREGVRPDTVHFIDVTNYAPDPHRDPPSILGGDDAGRAFTDAFSHLVALLDMEDDRRAYVIVDSLSQNMLWSSGREFGEFLRNMGTLLREDIIERTLLLAGADALSLISRHFEQNGILPVRERL